MKTVDYKEAKSEKKSMSKNEKLVQLATERFTQAVDAESDNRSRAIADIRFVDLDEQWDEKTKLNRESNGRPCMTINKCAGVVRMIENDARQNKPRIKIRPGDSKADESIAEIYNGIIRNIETRSDAEAAYDTGIGQAIRGGWGYWRVVTEYASDDVFEQDIFIRRVCNQFSVYLDPEAKEADFSDAKWGFITEVLTRKEFEEQYPDADAVEWSQQGDGEGDAQWFTDDGIRVAEYYYKKPVTKTLWQTKTITDGVEDYDTIEAGDQEIIEQNGKRYFIVEPEYEENDDDAMAGPGGDQAGQPEEVQEQPMMAGPEAGMGMPPQGPMPMPPMMPQPPPIVLSEIVAERKVKTDQLMWCKLAGDQIIEGPIEQSGRYIPIVKCVGDVSFVEGEPVYKSAFFHSKDAQRVYNWAESNLVETLALSPKQPFIGTPEMFEGHEDEWDSANTTPKMRLMANFDQGQLPQRQTLNLTDNGSMQVLQQAADDIKATTGYFDASLGNKSNETSGRAIMARQTQSDTSTFHFPDNQARAIKYTGKILVDIIPHVYDTERIVRLLGKDDAEDWQYVNKRVPDPNAPGGYRVINDLSVGRYDVAVDIGPGFLTKRIEAAEGMVNFLSSAPNAAPALLPRIAKNLDWPEHEEIAEELRALMNPPQQPQDPAAQQQQQMMMQAQAQEVQMKLQGIAQKNQLEGQKAQADIQKTQLELQKGQQELQNGQLKIEEQQLKNAKLQQEIQQGMIPRNLSY